MKQITILILVTSTILLQGTGYAASLAGCQILPTDNIWNAPVDTLPVAVNSALIITNIGPNTGLHADFGSGTWDDARIGIPITIVNTSQPLVPIIFGYEDESDPGPYPIPPNAAVEGEPNDGDRHVLVLNQDDCKLYEMFFSWHQNDDSWEAGSGAVFDLTLNNLRPDTWTSADAAGLPILPGLVRYEEAASGTIDHAIRFTVSQSRDAYVWPARHEASNLSGDQYPPMGQRFRLKAGIDISGFTPINQTILQAMKTYGIILADNGSNWYISGEPSESWNNDDLHELGNIKGSDFEAIDVSSLMADPDSGQVVSRAGDIDNSTTVDLTDAILALQVVVGLVPTGTNINIGGDVNDDNHIGLEEVIYILQDVSNFN